MKQFRFRFETVLSVKKLTEEILQQQLADLQSRLLDEETALIRALDRIAGTEQALLVELREKTPMHELSLFLNYLATLRREALARGERIRELEGEVAAMRDRLIQASQEKKIFENLKDRDFKQYQTLVSTEEQKFLDEVTTTHHRPLAEENGSNSRSTLVYTILKRR